MIYFLNGVFICLKVSFDIFYVEIKNNNKKLCDSNR